MDRHPGDDEIAAALERFTELAEVMPGGLAIVEDAATLARIVNALPPDTEIMFEENVLAVPGWRQAPDPVITGVAQLSWAALTEPISAEEVAANPDLEGRHAIVDRVPALLLGRRILLDADGDPRAATELAYREARAEQALEDGDTDVFLAELSALLSKWGHLLDTDAVDTMPSWLESLPQHEAAIHDDSWMDESFDPEGDSPAARLQAEQNALRQGMRLQAAILRDVGAALGRLYPPRADTRPANG